MTIALRIPSVSTSTKGALAARFARFGRTPKSQVLILLLVMAAIAAPAEDALGPLAAHVLRPVLVAAFLDLLLSRKESGRWTAAFGATLTGLFVALILDPRAPWYVGVTASIVAILSKHIVRIRREHVFNPAALGLLAVGIVFGSGQDWWGALANQPALWLAVPVVAGYYIVERLNKLPLILTFFATYFGLWTALSYINASTAAEIFRPPFVQSALFMAIFMLTDPPTSPIRYEDQAWYGAIAAAAAFVAALIGVGQLFLLVGVFFANLWLGFDRLIRRLQAWVLADSVGQ